MYYNKYYYDEANQLVREDNRLEDFTGTYTYDVGGNIVSRIRYPYTEGEITGLSATETHTYSYTDSTWGDILTAYNGQNVTYDAMGNITSLDGDTYTWTAGRQLSRITKADNTYIDYFYDDGGQISRLVMYNEEGVSEGGFEYFWEGTTLIGTKTLPGTTDTEEDTYFTRIIYDTEGEPLGFLLNDALPFLYTKNILGDITGVINYETSEYLFRYSYDAYGNYELIPTGNDVGSVLFATILSGLNPLSYRGYIFTPAIGISHYLGSRFYVPTLCRFMNADVYADTAQGVVGANMFAYCNNNPILFLDPNGQLSISKFIKTVRKVVNFFVSYLLVMSNPLNYTFASILQNHIETIVDIEKHDFNTKTNAYIISISLNTKFNKISFADYIFDEYKKIKDDVFEEITNNVEKYFTNEMNRPILFSSEGLENEIKQHIEGYWWASDKISTMNTMVVLYSLIAGGTKSDVLGRCASIDINEGDPIYEEEEFIGGIPYRKQNYMFDYFGNIRKCYEKKLSDPFFNPISQKRERDYWKNNKKWRIE